MQVLIDGNNLLHAAQKDQPDHPISRLKLSETLCKWSKRYRRSILIVFDGDAAVGGLGQQFASLAVDVRFSGRGVSADTVVEQEIQRHSAPRRLLVVSSDRAIEKAARSREAQTIGAADFWARVCDDLARPERPKLEPPAKRRGLSPEETSAWMREMGFD